MIQSNSWYVVTGGPSTGKTTLLSELQKLGHHTFAEAARVVIDEGLAKGLSLKQIRADEKQFQMIVLQRKVDIELSHKPTVLTFFDRGMHDSLAYFQLYGWKIEDEVRQVITRSTYKKVFLLEPLDIYESDYARTEPRQVALKLNKLLYDAYASAGMRPIKVPVFKPIERAKFVLRHVG